MSETGCRAVDDAVAAALAPFQWAHELPISITVCDEKGIILFMNKRSCEVNCKDGRSIIGNSLFDCHPEPAAQKLRHLLETHEKSFYTIEKMGVKKMICQVPWFKDGVFGGYVELSIEIPFEMPHYIRTPKQPSN